LATTGKRPLKFRFPEAAIRNRVLAKRSISFLYSRRSAKPNSSAIEIYEAVVGDLSQPAMSERIIFERWLCANGR